MPPVWELKACPWGGCNGTGPVGGRCSRCGTPVDFPYDGSGGFMAMVRLTDTRILQQWARSEHVGDHRRQAAVIVLKERGVPDAQVIPLKVTPMPDKWEPYVVHDGKNFHGHVVGRCRANTRLSRSWRILDPTTETTCKKCLQMRERDH